MAGKNAKPPPLPIDVFERVLRVANFDGRLLVVIAGTFALMAAMGRNLPPTLAGVLASGWGIAEIHGSNKLRNGDPRGLDWMIGSQLGLMLTVFFYAGWMMTHFEVNEFLQAVPPIMMKNLENQFAEAGLSSVDIPRYFESMSTLVYSLVALLTFIFQGLMARYYHRSRPAVETVIFGSNTR
jgi:hypothetical protein